MKKIYSLVIAVFFLNFLAGTFVGYWQGAKSLAVTDRLAGAASAQPEASLKEKAYEIHSGESIYVALRKFDIPHSTILQWQDLAKPIYDLSAVKPGQSIKISSDQTGAVARFELEIKKDKKLVITRDGEGYDAELVKDKVEIAQNGNDEEPPAQSGEDRLNFYQGVIERTLYQSGIDSGMDPSVVMGLSNIFTHQFNVTSRMKKGDRFAVLTEPVGSDDERIVAAQITVGKKTYRAYYSEDASEPGYFDDSGIAWEGFQLLKPVAHGRISSTYTKSRFHPILHYYRPHLAVDYAAPSGTPVKAAGSGVVTFAGYKGGYGNYMEIKHNGTYLTTYGHLRGFAKGIRKGVRVKQGQLVAYVGRTGMATGPHLDYRIMKNGSSINPIKFKGKTMKAVRNLADFKLKRIMLEVEIASYRNMIDIPTEHIMLSSSAIANGL
jgi:murein DD-endopeptidase MepM/ murein hydrolase activator NlpD